MGLATCTYRGCGNEPRVFSTVCNAHLNERREVLHSLDRVASTHRGVAAEQAKFIRSIQDARRRGATWTEIGRAIGKTRQYAQRKFAPLMQGDKE
ncbi:DNA binding protein [Rhodococcus phage Reynauld]|uniref:DNA binding protein n=1 Tax=Rhodococcus phage Reynauld TaxID=3062845 RepID=A0ACD4UJR0_9CAUD|nr:DNA binding protein [Rhodococcus phage Reynauld]